MASVAALLQSSQQAHLKAQVCRKRKDVSGHWQCVSEALELRLQADALDPDHADPAWSAEVTKRFRHDEILAWYRQELGIAADQKLEPVNRREFTADGLRSCVA